MATSASLSSIGRFYTGVNIIIICLRRGDEVKIPRNKLNLRTGIVPARTSGAAGGRSVQSQ